MKENQNPKIYSCNCSSCKNARKELKKLSQEDSANSYFMTNILKEVLGQGNY